MDGHPDKTAGGMAERLTWLRQEVDKSDSMIKYQPTSL
jgi:hypothetical protein